MVKKISIYVIIKGPSTPFDKIMRHYYASEARE